MAEIIRAKNSGFCFGVKQAIEKTEAQVEQNQGKRIFTCGPLIHNQFVTGQLAEKGVGIIYAPEEAEAGDVVIVRSHGETKAFFDAAAERNLEVIDATCPFVKKIHKLVFDADKDGKTIVIVGDRNHPEVVGINGWCGNKAYIVNSGEDTTAIEGNKVFLVCQTTIKKELLDEIILALEGRGVEMEVNNTICNATRERQESCDQLSKEVDAMVIVGGRNSSNTRKLYEISQKNCNNSYFVENIADLPLKELKKCNKIGIAAGASTPECVIKEVIANMS